MSAPSNGQLKFEATAERVTGATMEAGSKVVSGISHAASGALNKTTNIIKQTETSKILTCMSLFNFINGIGIVLGGVVMFLMIPQCYATTNCPSSSLGIISFYTIIFGLMILAFEGKIAAAQKYSTWLRKHFGFMFSYTGRMLFLLFISTMLFSSLYEGFSLWWVSLLVGLVTAINALFNCLVIWYHPGFQGQSSPGTAAAHHDIELGAASQSPFGNTMTGTPQPMSSAASYGDNPFMSGGGNSNDAGQKVGVTNYETSATNPFTTVVT